MQCYSICKTNSEKVEEVMEQEVVQTRFTDAKGAVEDLCRNLKKQPELYNCLILKNSRRFTTALFSLHLIR